ncbi:MAG: hypothetical protein LBS66_00315 [Rhodospirillaceae bacterium]|nr:hypothetical protein [Rhodospirillaceae bacterium]
MSIFDPQHIHLKTENEQHILTINGRNPVIFSTEKTSVDLWFNRQNSMKSCLICQI